jgi:hypothetical protein
MIFAGQKIGKGVILRQFLTLAQGEYRRGRSAFRGVAGRQTASRLHLRCRYSYMFLLNFLSFCPQGPAGGITHE